ncbi:helix-turn-helix domain-containing protein [Phaeovulum sp. W22_SRMD_FR3]|uniref:helix-turn-helix domain-containing protein n=1 Tax=Phaeovulum sp. W22_SRMD_FR3 TaxID=3240274 RepID=UPI003F9C82B3
MILNTLVGNDIRALRKSRGITIKELTTVLGRSVGWLSQVERGQTMPSINDLSAIAQHFGVSISFFFRSENQRPEERGLIMRAADRMTLGTTETGLTEELLSPTLGGSFEMIKSTFAPGGDSGGMKTARASEDGGILIAGRLTLRIDDLEVLLETGDSFQFQQKSYGWKNEGSVPAVIIWVVSPPIY